MADLNKSEALILRRFRHGDTSLVLHAFTRTGGRVPFIAKGARSGGRKPPVPLVPAVLLEFIWKTSTKSELQLLREWSLLDGYGAIHNNFKKLAWTQAGLEVLGRTMHGEQEHQELFDASLEYIESVRDAKGRYLLLLEKFRMITLRELGFALDLTVPEGAGHYRFNPSSGNLVARSGERDGLDVSLGAWKTLAALDRTPFSEVHRLKPGRDAERQMTVILDSAYRHAFERWQPLESLKLLNPLDSNKKPGAEQ